MKVAINGFGRIGRVTFRVGFGRPNFEIVAVNDLTDAESLAHLLRWDTVYGRYEKEVSVKDGYLVIEGKKIKVLSEKDPALLPWKELGIDIVLECTGKFTSGDKAQAHLKAGAKRVIISAPAKDEVTPTLLLGVNAEQDKGEGVISNASCTTNSISPVIALMHAKIGVKKAVMTTVHAYTADQNLQDGPHKDLRRARAAAANIVPTTTGAAIATTKTIPQLKDKFDGTAIRVPVPVGSIADIVMVVERPTTVEEINDFFKEAERDPIYHGILAVTEEPLVSSDIVGRPESAIVDLPLTKVIGGDLVKVVAWYDNEWGYSVRLVELAEQAAKKLP